MTEINTEIPLHYIEWVELKKSVESNYPEKSEVIIQHLESFHNQIVSLLGDKFDKLTLEIITMEIMSAGSKGKELQAFGLDLKHLRQTFKNSCLSQLNIPYIRHSSNLEFLPNKFYTFSTSDTADAEWFLQSFSSDVVISSELFKLTNSSRSVESLQDTLFDFLGAEKIDLTCDLIKRRDNVVTQIFQLYERRTAFVESNSIEKRGKPISTISFSNNRIKSDVKRMKRENKKNVDGFNKRYSHINWAFADKFFAEIKNCQPQRKSRTSKKVDLNIYKYPHVYNDEFCETKDIIINCKKLLMPSQTKIHKTRTYECYEIPAATQTLNTFHERIAVAALGSPMKKVFEGIESFNRIQSIIFDCALHSNENLLICAPTGAGKTNIALLTILRELILVEEKKITRNDLKIVYIAPMKALASEITFKFNKALSFLGLKVLEVTGDTQFPKNVISTAHVIVTTPEKWDILTRKANSETAYTLKTRLLIIDEIHLLQEDRGATLEAIVARSLRALETNQLCLRIIGLSATLPNYIDVALFLKVDPYSGMFYFDGSFRPVPLEQQFIGVKTSVNTHQTFLEMERVCFEKINVFLRDQHQVIVFVHSREATRKAAFAYKEMLLNTSQRLIIPNQHGFANSKRHQFHSNVLDELADFNISIHHAGLSKHDRTNVEKMFSHGLIRVLFSTSTLAWGVNLPAHTVIIKGTSYYDTNKGSFTNIGILDVQQMFGRAGRPQFDTQGCGILITEQPLLSNYIGALVNNYPIESKLITELSDSLNAEISLGSITSINEAVTWLSYTFLYVRMTKNPIAYGITQRDVDNDPNLIKYRKEIIIKSVKALEKSKMIRFNAFTGYLSSTALGIIGSHYYIKHLSIDFFNDNVKKSMTDVEVFLLISKSSEFEQLKVRDDELPELINLNAKCPHKSSLKDINTSVKVMILLQAYVSQIYLSTPSLASDMMYISQNIGRLVRGYYEICVYHGFPCLIDKFINLIKTFDLRLWPDEHPLAQFSAITNLNHTAIDKIKRMNISIDRLLEYSESEISILLQNNSLGAVVKNIIKSFPRFEMTATTQTLTRSVLQITLTLTPLFEWNNNFMTAGADDWVFWIEDYDTHYITYFDQLKINSKKVSSREQIVETFTIPIFEPLPSQYIIRLVSLKFFGAETEFLLSTVDICLPEIYASFTKLLPLQPLPTSSLSNINYTNLYPYKFFNPIQTQLFHSCYHKDDNIFLGAPTGSGKTIVAELTMLRLFNTRPGLKVVYISPMKALIKERVEDWGRRMGSIRRIVVELTGDVNPDIKRVIEADIILTTPEKWDGITRGWKDRIYVRNVGLIIIDEVHLLGGDRGHILEAIVSRSRIIMNETGNKIRVVALSTSVSNSFDLAKWLDIQSEGLFNFEPSIRLVPLQAHILGFPTKHYCPRMESMNKSVYQSIKNYSPDKPVLIFASSRRQTRRTAEVLLTLSLATDNRDNWCHCDKNEIVGITEKVSDACLKSMLPYGIGIHHAGLIERDRRLVEDLFLNNKIQILIATSTLAWGVNFPAHLVIIKGTEYHDVKTHTYIDFPITDILQMMGRAGRPQYDTSGVGVILVHQPKKNFYKRFLYEPFPVESSFLNGLSDHLNAEIGSKTIICFQDAINYLRLSYFIRRILRNPTFYGFSSTDSEYIESHIHLIIQRSIDELMSSGCVVYEAPLITPTYMGILASHFYISHLTMRMFKDCIKRDSQIRDLLMCLSQATEFEKVPVRHNEDAYNEGLAKILPIQIDTNDYSSPLVKTFLLLEAHIGRYELPIKDYYTDTKSVLDQALRILQAMIDVCVHHEYLKTALQCIVLLQCVTQGCWWHKSSILCIPGVDTANYNNIKDIFSQVCNKEIDSLAQLSDLTLKKLAFIENRVKDWFGVDSASLISNFIKNIPVVKIRFDLFSGKKFISFSAGKDKNKNCVKVAYNEKLKIVCDLSLKKLIGVNCDKLCYSRVGKDVDESWVLVLGNKDLDKLISVKRISPIRYRTKTSLFIGPWFHKDIGLRMDLTIFLLSESMYGLDQQYEIPIEIMEDSEKD